MNGFFYDSWPLLFGGLVLGLIFGVIYDFFRFARLSVQSKRQAPKGRFFELISPKRRLIYITRKKSKTGKNIASVVIMIEDILFFIIVGALIVLFFLGKNDGAIRLSVIAFSAIGFIIYLSTVGKITFLASEYIIFFARCLLYWIFYVILLPIRFVLKITFKAAKTVFALTIGRIVDRHKMKTSAKIEKELICGAADGFGIFKEIYDE